MADEVILCDGCGHPAPRRRAVYYSTRGARVLAGRYGRVCRRRSVLALRESNLVPVDENGKELR